MLEDLRDQASEVDLSVKKLRQSVAFIVSNYDYYHQGNEAAIIEEKRQALDHLSKTFDEFKKSCEVVSSVFTETQQRLHSFDEKISAVIDKYGLPSSVVVTDLKTIGVKNLT